MLHDAQVVVVDIVVLVLVVVVVVTVVCVVLTFLFAIQRRYFIADFSRIWLLAIGSRFKLVHRKIVFHFIHLGKKQFGSQRLPLKNAAR